jgi:DNA (cytosine-5)-methyltransferase 1
VRELIIDNFAGGGGASCGIEAALGRPVDIAINHSPAAMAMHEANHPNTRHLIEDVFKVKPREATGGAPVGLAWFSPDCRHFSKAKGGKPVDRKIRGLAGVAIKWAEQVRPRVIMLENVEEFKDWGPLIQKEVGGVPQFTEEGKPVMVPDPARKGLSFRRWVGRLRNLGYVIESRELVAADYGAPTTRKRLFLIARCDGRPIVWPDPTHRDPRLGDDLFASGLLPWRSAAECIDFSIPCPSIFSRKKPLAEKTLARVAEGLRRYVIDCADPFIVGIDNQSSGAGAVWPLDEPLRTITQENRFALVAPHVTKFRNGAVGSPGDVPMPTVTANSFVKRPGGAAPLGLVAAFLSKYHGQHRNESRCHRPDDPIRTLDTQNRFALATAFLSKFYGTNVGSDMRAPMPTVTGSGQHIAEVRAFLIKYYGTGCGQDLRAPMHTITAKDRLALVMVHGELYEISDIGLRMLTPRELANAQGFPSEYILTGPGYEQVARIGNSVPPPFVKALVSANLPDMIVDREEAVA